MNRQILRSLAPAVHRAALIGLVLGIGAHVGCDVRTWSGGGNRVEQLNDATKRLIAVLKAIDNEAAAKENQLQLAELADEIQEIRKGIDEAGGKSESSGGMIANYRPWQLQIQMETSVRSQRERIRSDPKASEIVEQALEGAGFGEIEE